MRPVVGVTGTQGGCQPLQRRMLRIVLAGLDGSQLHHGDCIGVDDEAHRIGGELNYWRGVHPPIDQRKACGHMGECRYPPKPYLDRDGDIAEACHVLVACPGEFEEQVRSGTWATVRRARKRGRPIILIFPDGSVKTEGPTDLYAWIGVWK